MNIKSYDPAAQAILVASLIVLNTVLLISHASWVALLSILLLKVYQTIGGGGVHLWACHSLGDKSIGSKLKATIGFFWLLCGISRASFFCKYHIIHHYFCDKEGDPHSPNHHNVLSLTFGLWGLTARHKDKYITKEIQDKLEASYDRIASNQIMNFTDRNYYLLIYTLLLVSMAISPFFCLYFVALPMLLNIIDGNFFFVYYFHKQGTVRNIPWVNYWILNSGNHKSHHKWLR